MSAEQFLWLVMRMRKWDGLFEPINGIPVQVVKEDMVGFIPVFSTREAALKVYPDDEPIALYAVAPAPVETKPKKRRKK
jgi:hypothetical protein